MSCRTAGQAAGPDMSTLLPRLQARAQIVFTLLMLGQPALRHCGQDLVLSCAQAGSAETCDTSGLSTLTALPCRLGFAAGCHGLRCPAAISFPVKLLCHYWVVARCLATVIGGFLALCAV